MRALWMSALALAWWPLAAAGAQSAREPAENPEIAEQGAEPAAPDPGEPTEEIVVRGRRGRDAALEAFRNGDYVTAEIEFGNNLECALQMEALEGLVRDQGRSDGGEADAERMRADAAASARAREGLRLRSRASGRTCDRPEWQLYMMGLSQAQQSKLAAAKASFYRVIALSKDELLYDAHYRIGLLEVLDGDLDRAEERLTYLMSLRQRCRRRGARCEIRGELDEPVAFLERAITDSRAEAAASEPAP